MDLFTSRQWLYQGFFVEFPHLPLHAPHTTLCLQKAFSRVWTSNLWKAQVAWICLRRLENKTNRFKLCVQGRFLWNRCNLTRKAHSHIRASKFQRKGLCRLFPLSCSKCSQPESFLSRQDQLNCQLSHRLFHFHLLRVHHRKIRNRTIEWKCGRSQNQTTLYRS